MISLYGNLVQQEDLASCPVLHRSLMHCAEQLGPIVCSLWLDCTTRVIMCMRLDVFEFVSYKCIFMCMHDCNYTHITQLSCLHSCVTNW